MITKHCTVELFKADVLLLVGKYVDLTLWVQKNIPKKHRDRVLLSIGMEEITDFSAGRTFLVEGGGSIIWLPKWDKNVFAHEITHSAMNLFQNRETPVNKDTEEIFCYLVEFLTKNLSL